MKVAMVRFEGQYGKRNAGYRTHGRLHRHAPGDRVRVHHIGTSGQPRPDIDKLTTCTPNQASRERLADKETVRRNGMDPATPPHRGAHTNDYHHPERLRLLSGPRPDHKTSRPGPAARHVAAPGNAFAALRHVRRKGRLVITIIAHRADLSMTLVLTDSRTLPGGRPATVDSMGIVMYSVVRSGA